MTKIFCFALLLLWVVSLKAVPVSVDQARNVASHFLRSRGISTEKSILRNVPLGMKSSSPEYYVFNSGNNGFVIISGDDAVVPVLGYSTESSFSGNNVPSSLKAMLKSYAEQISFVRTKNIQADQNISLQWQYYLTENTEQEKGISVTQLLTCQWNQGSPYNALCPIDPAGPGDHVYAGCVATAMAMTMYYYRYPVQPTGFHGYNSSYGYLSVDFTQSHYSYEQMPFQLTSANYDAAKLQYDCGVSVDMMYGPSGSGAYMGNALNAMKDHFGYNPSATLEYKDNYTETDWKNMLKAQLDAGHPLPYAGYDVSAGHAFVCDGYNGDMFHFNWGWSGSYNGFYYIDNLNPGYDFSTGQQAFVNCYPVAVTYPSACGNYQMTTRSGSMEVGHGMSGYSNNQTCSWLIEPSDSVQYISVEFRYLNTESGNDIVTLYSGADETAPVVGTYSGNLGSFSVQVPGNEVFMTFNSNASITAGGFHADYYAYTPPFCTILDIRNDSAGTINDGSHSYPYNNNTVCRWRIEPPGAEGIMIDFSEFKLEQNTDFLYFYQYPSYILVDSLSGTSLPQSFFINSPRTMVIFKSNDANTDAGFTFNYHGVTTGVSEYQDASMYVSLNENSFPVLNISNFPSGQYTVELCDLTGRVLFSDLNNLTGSVDRIEIPLRPENAGLYLISLKGQKMSRTIKFIAR